MAILRRKSVLFPMLFGLLLGMGMMYLSLPGPSEADTPRPTLAGLQQQVDALNTQVAAIPGLQQQVTTLQGQVGGLTLDLAALDASLATVAFSGEYADLDGKPNAPLSTTYKQGVNGPTGWMNVTGQQITGRQLQFNKLQAGTRLRITYCDNVANQTGWGSPRVYIDGSPTNLIMNMYDPTNNAEYKEFTKVWYLDGLAAGNHLLDMRVQMSGTGSQAYFGNYVTTGSYLVQVEELP